MSVTTFRNNDQEYLGWVELYPGGFVVNTYRKSSRNYLMLHRATCGSIRSPHWTNYTTNEFIKVCALDLAELEAWASRDVGGSLQPCGLCRP